MKRRDLLKALGAALPLSMVRDDWMAGERAVEPEAGSTYVDARGIKWKLLRFQDSTPRR